MRALPIGSALFLSIGAAFARPDAAAPLNPFAVLGPPTSQPAHEPGPGVDGPRPSRGAVVGVDTVALRALLARAPHQRPDLPLSAYGLTIDLPMPTGLMVPCAVALSPVMEPALAEKYPQMQTVLVERLDGVGGGRLELTQRGLTGMIRVSADPSSADEGEARGGAWMLDLWRSDDPSRAVSYWLHDLPTAGDWTCFADADAPPITPPPASAPGLPPTDGPTGYAPRAASSVRTVRTAIACTGEWGQHLCQTLGHSPNVPDALAGLVTVLARANVVYEADLGVHFSMVANNDLLVFVNPATDPYPDTCDGSGGADCSSPILEANPIAINDRIGFANYDLGHVVTRIFGGVANLSAVCGSNKAGGSSGIPRGGDIDPVSALVVIHEMGHQFGATHTFSGTRGRCAGNVSLGSAWEAGSGSSPMAYPGGCPVGDAPPTDNVVLFADPFFHHGSLLQMQAFIGSTTLLNCLPPVNASNQSPLISAWSGNTAVPPGTPFVLTLTASDPDGDTLTTSWEQYDSGVARPLSGTGANDNGQGALFRAFPPTLSQSRTFPRMADVLSGVPTPGERLPTSPTTPGGGQSIRKFRAVVRDNHAGSGGTAMTPLINVTIAPGMTPFTVTGPTQGASVERCGLIVTWNVGGTTLSPVGLTNVAIQLSLDDGATFPYPLGTFPNTGSATIDPALLTTPGSSVARVRIDAVGRIFFNVSRPFTLAAGCLADFDGSGGTPDAGDVGAYFVAWLAGDPAADTDCSGGTPDSADVADFFVQWLAGGC